jgi:hypothetical protein
MDDEAADTLNETLGNIRQDWENVPGTLKDISAELSLIRKALEQIAGRLEAGS